MNDDDPMGGLRVVAYILIIVAAELVLAIGLVMWWVLR